MAKDRNSRPEPVTDLLSRYSRNEVDANAVIGRLRGHATYLSGVDLSNLDSKVFLAINETFTAAKTIINHMNSASLETNEKTFYNDVKKQFLLVYDSITNSTKYSDFEKTFNEHLHELERQLTGSKSEAADKVIVNPTPIIDDKSDHGNNSSQKVEVSTTKIRRRSSEFTKLLNQIKKNTGEGQNIEPDNADKALKEIDYLFTAFRIGPDYDDCLVSPSQYFKAMSYKNKLLKAKTDKSVADAPSEPVGNGEPPRHEDTITEKLNLMQKVYRWLDEDVVWW
jgi:hypothetical protein